jgi:hypothetical protein
MGFEPTRAYHVVRLFSTEKKMIMIIWVGKNTV